LTQLPRYTKKDLQILAINMPFIVILINSLLFGKRYFTEPKLFFLSGLIVLVIMTIAWFSFTWIAVTVRSRFPSNKQLMKRLAVTISLIAIIQALVMTLFFHGYSHFNLFGYELNETRYYWTLAVGFLCNILITMLHEGFDSFERWKTTLTETEQLKTAYTQSQLLGLKSQVNPHFLFNSLNSLSSLISEDAEKAETFLNELTKVYRYLLRTHDEKLVTLETELQFIQSYYYLLKARYGDCVDLQIDIDESRYDHYVSPLLLQTIFEYSVNNNILLKECPLKFSISIDKRGSLLVENNMQVKQTAVSASIEGIANLIEKYKLLCAERVEISRREAVFSVKIPLISQCINTEA
jgi:two-component system, LytTR family, sensor kinase